MIITIDGPAASGKGTLARALAEHLGFAHLDTGGLYRAVALQVLLVGADPEDDAFAVKAAQSLNLDFLDHPLLRRQATGQAASKVSRYDGVRAALLDLQRDFAANPPGEAKGAVLDGRDTGSVICPNADVKLYVEASSAERARRRAKELETRGEAADLNAIQAEIEARDHQDMTRAQAPLIVPQGAVRIDTTALGIEESLKVALKVCRSAGL